MAYTGEEKDRVIETICAEIAQGAKLVDICARDDMPGYTTVMRWRAEDAAFRELYVRAREDQADHYADEIVHIADTEPDPQKAKVKIDARKWVASKLKSRDYGDKLELGGDVTLTLTSEQRQARIKYLMAKNNAQSGEPERGGTDGTAEAP